MIPMSSSSSHNSTRRRSAATHAPRRRPLARSNSSLLGALKNIVTAPLAWFATTDDFEETPDLKGKRRRHLAPTSGAAADDSEDAPRTKRPRVKSPDTQIQFHPEPPYVPQAYAQAPSGYLDPPSTVFDNHSSFFRANSVNIPALTLNPLNTSIRSGLSRTMSIDPPSRDTPRNSTPLDRDISMEASSFMRTSSSIPRDHSMPLPPTRSLRMRTSLTPQPAQPREVSEPPPISSLAQKPVFVRPPSESHQRLSSQSSSSTLGSLVESQRSTRSPIRQHSLLFGSGSQAQPSEVTHPRHPPPAERALHELDVYKTPLLPTRSRLRTTAASSADPALPPSVTATADPSDMFRPRRSSQLLLMRDDRRANALGRKSSYGFFESESPHESEGKTTKAKVNDTKPYAGEGGMKKLLARRMKEVQADEEQDPVSQPERQTLEPAEELQRVVSQPLPLPPGPSDWQTNISAQPAASGSSLRVGRTKTSRTHIARPSRPSKFSAAFVEEVDDSMEDEEETRRQKERQELEETAKKLPTFNVPSGFTFAKEPNAKPVEFDASAKEPPIAALPFSFGKPPVPAEPVVPIFVPTPTPAVFQESKPAPVFSFANDAPSSASEKTAQSEGTSSGTVPNFFASSKFVSQAPVVSTLLPPAMPLFDGASESIVPAALPVEPSVTPKPPATPALPSLASAPTPIKDSQNPLWDGEGAKKSDGSSSLFGSGTLPKADSFFGGSTPTPTIAQPVSIFGAAKKDEPSLFGASKPQGSSGFSFGAPSSTSAALPLPEPSKTETKSAMSFGSMSSEPSTSVAAEAPKATTFTFGQPAAVAPATETKPLLFGAPPAASNPFASSAPAASEAPKPAFGGFTAKATPATSSPFAFGAPPAAPAETTKPAAASPFTFGSSASASASTPAFGFGASSTDTAKPAASGAMFSFGTPAVIPPTARPVTPPKNDMQEFKMEESPTRDMQTSVDTKAAESRPTLGGGGSGFSFVNSNPPSGSSLFGAASTAPAPAPFSFGASSSAPNPFAAPSSTENKPFDFGRSSNASTSSPFAFGQNNASASSSIDPPRPSTTGSFSFGSSSTSTSTGFSFGSGNQTTANPFSSLPSGGSAPSSPSTFSQPFSFGPSAPSQPAPFSFSSSQPVSPAGGPSNLPQQPTTPGGFGGGSFGAQPVSPFGAPPQGGGSSLFTIGSAPPPATGNTSRVMKKLPRRKN